MLRKIKGFTLSEVLIALIIIGIIAAVTIPLLIANYQEQALKSSLKKNYSVLKQALDRYQADNGERLRAVEGNDGVEYRIKGSILNYFNVIYDCGYGANSGVEDSCIPNYQDASKNSTTYKTYNGNTMNLYVFDDGQFVLSDGSIILIENSTSLERVYISVDVNGYGKKPNRLGKDLFMFQLTTEGELLPMGAKGTDYSADTYCSKTSANSMNGAGCTYKVLQ